MYDAHCHLDDDRISEPSVLLERAAAAGLEGCIVAGVDPLRSHALIELSSHPMVDVTLGLHPWVAAGCAHLGAVQERLDVLDALLDAHEPVGLGECGLDRSRLVPEGPFEHQMLAFRAQLAMARARNLPVVLHVLKAHAEVLEVLKHDGLPKRGGMVHSFGGSWELAQDYLELGLVLSFSASILGAGRRSRRAVALLPAHCLLIETDAPDQCPNTRKPALNEPAFILDVVDTIAELRGCDGAAVAKLSAENTRRLFFPTR